MGSQNQISSQSLVVFLSTLRSHLDAARQIGLAFVNQPAKRSADPDR